MRHVYMFCDPRRQVNAMTVVMMTMMMLILWTLIKRNIVKVKKIGRFDE
jgi:hypothetical protein